MVVAEYVQLLLFVLVDFDLRVGDDEGDRVDWRWDGGCIVFALTDADFLSFFNKKCILALDGVVPMKPEPPGNADTKHKNDNLIDGG